MTAVFIKLLFYFWPFIREALFGGKFAHRLRRSRWLILSFMVNIAILVLFMSTLETTVVINRELHEYRAKTATLEAEIKHMRQKPPEYLVPEYVREQIATMDERLKEYRDELIALKAENNLLRAELTKRAGYAVAKKVTKDDVTRRLQNIQNK
jgi:cell division protein FtsB